jgi:hypothetical protein
VIDHGCGTLVRAVSVIAQPIERKGRLIMTKTAYTMITLWIVIMSAAILGAGYGL